jgi:hypothetical protein
LEANSLLSIMAIRKKQNNKEVLKQVNPPNKAPEDGPGFL